MSDRHIFDKLKDENYKLSKQFDKKLQMKLFGGSMAKKHLTLSELFKQRTFRTVGITAAAVLMVAGIFGFRANSQRVSNNQIIEDSLELADDLSNVLGLEEIRTIAEANKPEGTSVSEIELENEDGKTVYKVKYNNGSYILFDAVTGEKLNSSEFAEIDSAVPVDFIPGISLQEARNIASAQRPGKFITKIELENEDGVIVYSVRFADDGRVDVNATDGSVMRIRDGDSDIKSSDDSDDDDELEVEDESDSDDDHSGSSSGSGSEKSDSGKDDD